MGKELGFPDAFKDYKSAHFLQSVDVLSEFDSFDDASAAAAELMNNAANAMYGDYEIADAAHSEFSPMNAYGDYGAQPIMHHTYPAMMGYVPDGTANNIYEYEAAMMMATALLIFAIVVISICCVCSIGAIAVGLLCSTENRPWNRKLDTQNAQEDESDMDLV